MCASVLLLGATGVCVCVQLSYGTCLDACTVAGVPHGQFSPPSWKCRNALECHMRDTASGSLWQALVCECRVHFLFVAPHPSLECMQFCLTVPCVPLCGDLC